jgi:periplasmic protein TonB
MQGKILVDFVIDENGKVTMIRIKRGIDQYLDKEAIRVLESMPDWSPGRQNGQAVKVRLNIPIKCTLFD